MRVKLLRRTSGSPSNHHSSKVISLTKREVISLAQLVINGKWVNTGLSEAPHKGVVNSICIVET